MRGWVHKSRLGSAGGRVGRAILYGGVGRAGRGTGLPYDSCRPLSDPTGSAPVRCTTLRSPARCGSSRARWEGRGVASVHHGGSAMCTTMRGSRGSGIGGWRRCGRARSRSSGTDGWRRCGGAQNESGSEHAVHLVRRPTRERAKEGVRRDPPRTDSALGTLVFVGWVGNINGCKCGKPRRSCQVQLGPQGAL